MSYKNPYAKPNNPYSAASSSSATAGPYSPYSNPSAVAGPVAYPAYPQTAYPAVAGPSIPLGYDANAAQQASIYTPEAVYSGGVPTPAAGPTAGGSTAKGKARTTVLRKGGGEVWEDQSLLEWDPGTKSFLLSAPLTIILLLTLQSMSSIVQLTSACSSETSTQRSQMTLSRQRSVVLGSLRSSRAKSSVTSTRTKGEDSGS